ncbi:(2Fe-2S) ferredoxin domain-containing protein [Roseospira navarrensis]|uniref:(2Fe-2S) ferredoxin domain-containing protein n=1 Tax=Roseospira navarrensis TaxID=140058 RepID=A0A7X1ZE40_9PROT|nr:(2Fe-2S) ferredoxin domain-containing protein [Roseospira navarrensis]MQX35550.1 hypothetical protein [Roseospira navarrensis]
MSGDAGPPPVIACVKARPAGAPSCGGAGSRAVLEALRAEAARRGLPLRIEEVQCLGRCQQGPTLRILAGAFFTGMTPGRVGEVCDALAAQVFPAAGRHRPTPPPGHP